MSPIIAAVIAAVVGCLLGGLVGYSYRKSFTEKKIERTEDYACTTTLSARRKTTRRKRCWRPRRKS